MESLLNSIPLEPVILLLVILIERLAPIPSSYHPATVFRFVAEKMAKRVNPKEERPAFQRRLSGLLGMLTLLLPGIIILIGLLSLAEYPVFFEGMLLYFSLSWSGLKKDSRKAAAALNKGHKSLARDLLSPWLFRKTSNLSEFGICKAALEGILLRSVKFYFSIIFYYLLFGGAFAFTWRMMIELSHQWNTKDSHFKEFGKPVASLVSFFNWLPGHIFAFSLALLRNFSDSTRVYKQNLGNWPDSSSLIVLSTGAATLGVELGGPRFYPDSTRKDEHKVRLAKLGAGRAEPGHIKLATSVIEQLLWVWLSMVVLLQLSVFAINTF